MINTFIFFFYDKYISTSPESFSDEAEAVIILGSSVQGNQLSQIVQDRVEAAIEVYLEGKAAKILISGDGDDAKYYNEVKSINKYLLNRGIPPADVFVDFAGYDTYDSLWRAKEIYDIETLIISTQRFHLPRSLLIARTLGLDAYGIVADRTVYKSAAKNSLRESFARIKALIELALHSKPAVFTGEMIDIHGMGNTSTIF